jgi:hypothetical protein
MDLGKTITILLVLLTIGISTKMIIDENVDTDTPKVSGQSSSWLYRKAIEVENDTGIIQFEKDVLLTINTKELIAKGKLRPDCNDIRFLNEDHETPLKYQIAKDSDNENFKGCNSGETKIWVRVPTVERKGTIIYFLYGNNSAPDFQTHWEIQ